MKTAIYGIGNILMGDDGVGPAVVRQLPLITASAPTSSSKTSAPPPSTFPTYLIGYDIVIFIDAVALDAPAGTICLFSRDEIMAAPTGIRVSPHEPSINDALIVLDLGGGISQSGTNAGHADAIG